MDTTFRRLYYRAKPLLHKRLRLHLRSWLARLNRRFHGADWPIEPKAAVPPPGWRGWPGGKQFALVLTHDVESETGLMRVPQLAELEYRLGVRSSFNFIPLGDYEVPVELRTRLTQAGFEVGIHDLHHDGKLFESRAGFINAARQINAFVREWEACGFRSGFMLHRLDWLHDLNIAYDASTFDTDPFEPQPDGVGTIFPFWVSAPEAQTSEREALGASRSSTPVGGYVELPYTLPQDSTLFLLLRESNNEIWKTKLEFIADHGGMALLDTHPDYMSFDTGGPDTFEYDVHHYEELILHVQQRHLQGCWFALPREVAAYVAPAQDLPTCP